MRFALLFFLCHAALFKISAQRACYPQGIYWVRYYLRADLNSKTNIHWEADNRRFFAPTGGQHQFITHLHLHRTLGPGWEAWLGFSYALQSAQRPDAPHPSANAEKRPSQALIWQKDRQKTTFQARLRLEERFFRRMDSPGYRFAFRARYAFSVSRPIGKRLSIKTGEEAMTHWGEGIRHFFDQNRLWGALEANWNQNRCSVEFQYIWLWQQHSAEDIVYDRDVLRLTMLTKI